MPRCQEGLCSLGCLLILVGVGCLFIAFSAAGEASPPDKPVTANSPNDALPPGAIACLGSLSFRHDEGEITSLSFSPDGKTLASAGGGGIRLWETATGREVAQLKGPEGSIEAIAYSPDGRTLAAGSYDRGDL